MRSDFSLDDLAVVAVSHVNVCEKRVEEEKKVGP